MQVSTWSVSLCDYHQTVSRCGYHALSHYATIIRLYRDAGIMLCLTMRLSSDCIAMRVSCSVSLCDYHKTVSRCGYHALSHYATIIRLYRDAGIMLCLTMRLSSDCIAMRVSCSVSLCDYHQTVSRCGYHALSHYASIIRLCIAMRVSCSVSLCDYHQTLYRHAGIML